MKNELLEKFLNELPTLSKGAVVCLSGGLDSTTTLRLAVAKYSAHHVCAISFDYGQKQKYEIELAAATCSRLGVHHEIFTLDFLRHINIGFSANVDSGIEMPTIKDVLGDPQPVTYVANRNMILMSIAASYAEARGCDLILAGFQSNDLYGYWDTTPKFVEALNAVLDENRKVGIKVICSFVKYNKTEEIEVVMALDGNLDLYKNTLTCYNPAYVIGTYTSCGICPSCAERLAAFKKLGLEDPIPYAERH
jgi:7-cyano-7-deazaguanine synthase